MSRPQQDLIFKALADHRRREILDLLKETAKTTGELCDHFKKIDRCTVMQHLGVLEKAGLVIVRREGRRRWNFLNVVPIQ
jgi:DNA-binding transcriptional ArsR family regulator